MVSTSNISSDFTLLGLMEMESQKYLYIGLSTLIYSFILTSNSMILIMVQRERSLHEPMYLLIANLALNEIFGSTSFFPKLIADLISSSKTISRSECLIQILCISAFALFEMDTFTIMAYDRYLAICYPLQYASLMTYEKVLKVMSGTWAVTFMLLVIALLLTAVLPLCSDKINNIFCDNMSLVVLSCVDSSSSRLMSATIFAIYLLITIVVTVFSYLRIFLVCLNVSKESRQKAVHTVVTHLLNFSVFLIGVSFVALRYRLGNVTLPLTVHVLLSATAIVFPPLLNPLIYGIRTQALRTKLSQYLWNINLGGMWMQRNMHWSCKLVMSDKQNKSEDRRSHSHH